MFLTTALCFHAHHDSATLTLLCIHVLVVMCVGICTSVKLGIELLHRSYQEQML